jgi:hypothetical protein
VHLRMVTGLVVGLLLVVLAGCGAESEEPAASASPTMPASSSPAATPTSEPEPEPEPEPAAPGITITSAGSDFGPMLFDAAGQAIYIWELEPTSGRSALPQRRNPWWALVGHHTAGQSRRLTARRPVGCSRLVA